MKQQFFVRAALWVLCALMLIGAVACQGEPGKDGQNTQAETAFPTGETVTDAVAEEPLPERDMGQFELTFLNYTDAAHGWSVKTLVTDDISESINHAIYARNARVETKYNAVLREIETDNMTLVLQTSAMAGMDENSDFQVAMIFDEKVNGYYVNGYLTTWDRIPYCDFGQAWWNGEACELFSYRGKQFGAVGDFSLSMYSKDYCYFFNKNLYATIAGSEDLYELVRNKEWTLEKMIEIGERYTRDLNGDGLWYDGSDQYGIAGTVKVHYQLVMSGSGLKLINIDRDGNPYFGLYNQTSVLKLMRLIDLFNSTNAYYNSNPGNPTGGSIPDVFMAGRNLFFSATIHIMATTFKDAEFPVGIMPAPMYDADQGRYYSVAIGGEIACLPRLIREEDTENTGILLEAMSYYSHDTLVPAYRERTVKTRYAESYEDSEMLQLIFDTTVLDLGTTIWNNDVRAPIMRDLFAELNSSVASYIKAMAPKVEAAIEKSMTADVTD